MISIRIRLIVLFIVVTTTTLGAFGIYNQMLMSRDLELRFLQLQDDVVTHLQASLADPVWALDQSVIMAKLEAALTSPDVQAVYLLGPDQTEIKAGVVRNIDGVPHASLNLDEAHGIAVKAYVYPPTQVDEARRKISIGKIAIYFSHDRIDGALRVALSRNVTEVLTMDVLLLVMLILSLRVVFVPLRGLRDALFSLASNEGEDMGELPHIRRSEFDEVIDGFNLTLRKLKKIILRSSQAEAAAREATQLTKNALAQVKVAHEELLEKNIQLEQLSATDQLTGLHNRARLDMIVKDELNCSRRYSSSFSLVFMDIDHFKSVNDNFGHHVGDQVLIEMAQILAHATRNVDIVGRWGGEEFLVICHDTEIDGAVELAEKLRKLIAEHIFPVVGSKTASFGVTCVRSGDTILQIMARADNALYLSKNKGRNRVESVP